MHLSFLYVESFYVLKNIGLSFDHRYSFAINDGLLHISRNNTMPEGFWENGIYSLTAIIGNNGCGKTTAMLLMKQLFVEGSPRQEDAKVLIVYEQQGELYIYNTTNIKITTADRIITHTTQRRNTIETLYYSGHFQPYTGAEGEMQLSGCYEASDAWLLIKDLQDYANVDTLQLSSPLYNHLLAYYAQNNYRICEVLALKGLDELLDTVRLPRFIQFAPNRGGWNAIKLDRMGRYKDLDIPSERLTTKTLKEQSLERFLYYDIINLIAENRGEQKELVEFLKKWIQADKSEGVIKTFEQRIASGQFTDVTIKVLQSLEYVIGKLEAICSYDGTTGVFYIDVREEEDKQKKMMEEIMRSPFFMTAKFFDIIYGHALGVNTRLSSGELELLNLLSRLYYGITLAPMKVGNLYSPRLLLLDEAEIGYHPAWQRQYVNVLNEFMKYMQVKSGVDFQVVITSHSPIILSDIPACCVNFLRRDGDVTTQITDEKESFGENVFNLYRRAFFMDDGLIGAFANKKIKQVVKDIEKGLVTEDTRKTIALVGDDRIRTYLLNRIAEQDLDSEIAYHEAKIRELKMRRRKDD